MADKLIYNFVNNKGETLPLKAIEVSTDTYALDTVEFSSFGETDDYIYNFVDDSGEFIPLAVKNNGDGSYSLYINITT